MINIVQLNAGKRVAAWGHLAGLIERGPRKPTVVLLQEQFRKKLPNGINFESQVSKSGNRRRASIFVSRDFAEQTGCHMKVIFCSSYFPGELASDSMIKPSMQRLVNHCKKNRIELLWGCDANAHSTDWGCQKTDARGDSLSDFCISNDLALLNTGEEPTFVRNVAGESGSIIDLTLATEKIYSLINDWTVCTSDYGSDHRAIEFSIEAIKPLPLTTLSKKKTSWKKFVSELGGLSSLNNLDMNMSPGQLDHAAFKLNDLLLKAYERSSKPIPKHPSYRQTWYSAKLDAEKTEKNRLHRMARKYKSAKIHAKYIEARNKYNASIKKAISTDFKRFTERLNDSKDIASRVCNRITIRG